jgi:hypothetical protein
MTRGAGATVFSRGAVFVRHATTTATSAAAVTATIPSSSHTFIVTWHGPGPQ